ncbi:MAG: class I SAM-dependent methyltransferase [Gemmatimonadetes bacterium]|nr:class I SAM-dependent methyltransferase [Gemmatimonadota bacterium]
MSSATVVNPHFDEERIVWSDDYSGRYEPPPGAYDDQFDDKWRLVLEDATGEQGYNDGIGVRMDDHWITRCVYDWIGEWREEGDPPTDLTRHLSRDVDPTLIDGKRCIDVGCGMGRWTRVMQRLGASEVVSVDISEHALESVRRFNDQVFKANILELCQTYPDLEAAFDYTNLWGVAHHTHDPRAAYMSAARTVKPGGSMYIMVYSPEGLHNTPLIHGYRRAFFNMDSAEERIQLVRAIATRKWHPVIPLEMRAKNIVKNLLKKPYWGTIIGMLDVLMPWYNWTIPLEVALGWFEDAGFQDVTVLNDGHPNRVAHHILGTGKSEPATA